MQALLQMDWWPSHAWRLFIVQCGSWSKRCTRTSAVLFMFVEAKAPSWNIRCNLNTAFAALHTHGYMQQWSDVLINTADYKRTLGVAPFLRWFSRLFKAKLLMLLKHINQRFKEFCHRSWKLVRSETTPIAPTAYSPSSLIDMSVWNN